MCRSIKKIIKKAIGKYKAKRYGTMKVPLNEIKNYNLVVQSPRRYKSSFKIAIVVHAYHLDRIDYILDVIANITYQYDLYFTVSKSSYKKLEEILLLRKIIYTITLQPNHGYDIAPFIVLLRKLKTEGYDLICKIHTKAGSANLEDHVDGIQDIWLHLLLGPILGSAQTIEKIIYSFEIHPDLGMVCSADCFKSACKLMYGNEQYTRQILDQLGMAYNADQQWGFAAGSIFWARIETLEPLIAAHEKVTLLLEEEYCMRTGESISIFHAMERVFGMMPQLTTMRWGLSYATNHIRDQHVIQVIHDEQSYASPLGIGMTLQNAHDEGSNYNILNKSTSFDIEYYLEHTPICYFMRMDPILHFLRYGVGLNSKPNPFFSPYIYWGLNNRAWQLRLNPFVEYLSLSKASQKECVLATCVDDDKATQLIKESNLFDTDYYIQNNSDVIYAGIDPLSHYCHFGCRERRNPSPVFDQSWYQQTYLAEYLEFVNPLLHYALVGVKRGYARNKLEYQSRSLSENRN